MQAVDAAFWVVIPASGVGLRFSSTRPKQYWSIDGKTVLEHSIERFVDHDWVNQVIVAIADTDEHFQYLSCAKHPKVMKVQGGETRSHSVMSALCYIEKHAKPHDWVLVHDAVRPCLHQRDLQALLQLRDDPVGGLLAIPVADTLKKASVNNQIHETLSRESLWAAQTPQMFRLALLSEALALAHSTGQTVTDESSALEAMGYHPHLVLAEHPNPKLTYAADLSYIRSLLAIDAEVYSS